MTDAQKTRTFDGKHKNQQVRLGYHLDKKSVRIVCKKPETGSEYLRKLITDGHIGLVDAVIYSPRHDSKVIALMRGVGLDKFLRAGVPPSKKAAERRKSFSQIAEESETGS
jgi:hypothetical protein